VTARPRGLTGKTAIVTGGARSIGAAVTQAIHAAGTWVMNQATGGNRAKVHQVAAPYHLLGRAVNPAEVARTALFLFSANASFITGSNVAVDGGYSAMGPQQAVPALPKLFE